MIRGRDDKRKRKEKKIFPQKREEGGAGGRKPPRAFSFSPAPGVKEITIKPDLARRYLLRENLLHVVARHLSAAVGVNNYLKHCPVTSRLLCKSKRSAVPKSVSKVTIATSGTEVPRYSFFLIVNETPSLHYYC